MYKTSAGQTHILRGNTQPVLHSARPVWILLVLQWCWMSQTGLHPADSYTTSPACLNGGYIVQQGVNIQTVKCPSQKMKKFLCSVLYQQQQHITLFRWAELFLVPLNMLCCFAQAARHFCVYIWLCTFFSFNRNPYNKAETPERWQTLWFWLSALGGTPNKFLRISFPKYVGKKLLLYTCSPHSCMSWSGDVRILIQSCTQLHRACFFAIFAPCKTSNPPAFNRWISTQKWVVTVMLPPFLFYGSGLLSLAWA